jgi:hypothetical protein
MGMAAGSIVTNPDSGAGMCAEAIIWLARKMMMQAFEIGGKSMVPSASERLFHRDMVLL